ncbi:hypothetical protein DSLASN_24150 [Desulfoluna limicola]|uniref:SWIM-type domain-containing protein n=1 Tax=Desulfoluna limicola TaxID=2810562 RepID=A0ABM7PGS8_9BACT|nr:hypothetical protein [Desulfoluna limicola]BCS96783.1 hypothetical protein DSLASN_24150 [Desulfoluna limicola]
MSRQPNPFSNLAPDDIDAWVEGSTADAGRIIHEKGGVSDLSLTEDGDLLAWVEGSARHAVMVFFEDQILTSVCTCAKATACEHAVAVAYESLLLDPDGIALPAASEDDERLTLLSDLNDEASQVDLYLSSLSRDELIELILDLTDDIPEVDEELTCRMEEAFSEDEI